MKNWVKFSLLLLVLFGACMQASEHGGSVKVRVFDNEKANWGFPVESYQFAFLIKPDRPHGVPADSLPTLQQNHLERLKSVYEAGHSLTYGPFGGDSLETNRGIVIFPGSTPEDSIKKWLGTNPYIQRGVMNLKVLKWWTGDSLVHFRDRRSQTP